MNLLPEAFLKRWAESRPVTLPDIHPDDVREYDGYVEYLCPTRANGYACQWVRGHMGGCVLGRESHR